MNELTAEPPQAYLDSAPTPVAMPAGQGSLCGDLILPDGAAGLVLFVRVDGKYRDYPNDRRVADLFVKYKLATLLIDLSSAQGQKDVRALADLLAHVLRWVHENPATARLPLGCFGVDVGAAVALTAAGLPESPVQAIVARDGQFEPAAESLSRIAFPILMIAGNDPSAIQHCKATLEKIKPQSTLNVIPHATKSFSEPDALEDATQLAALWFAEHLIPN